MPRSIIDTESSRPAYVRRRLVQAVVAILALVAILAGVYLLWGRPALVAHHAEGSVSRVIQETAPVVAESGAFHLRRSHAA